MLPHGSSKRTHTLLHFLLLVSAVCAGMPVDGDGTNGMSPIPPTIAIPTKYRKVSDGKPGIGGRDDCGTDDGTVEACMDPEKPAAGVRCCAPRSAQCPSSGLYPSKQEKICKRFTYAQAVKLCERAGSRLCTVAELQAGDVAGTGCMYDFMPVWASDECKADPEVVTEAVRTCRTALDKSSLQNDPAVVLEAVRAFGWSLRYASMRLRNDKAVVLAAVSSFGAGGSNAHLILEQYLNKNPVESEPVEPPFIFVVSARKKERLLEYTNKFTQYFHNLISGNDFKNEFGLLDNICYTSQTGREAMPHRLAIVVVSGIRELAEKLKIFRENQENNEKLEANEIYIHNPKGLALRDPNIAQVLPAVITSVVGLFITPLFLA